MGLLDDFPYGFLNQIRNAAQSRIPNGNFGADDASGFPSRVPQQQQRLPLSIAGPDLTPNIPATSPGRPADFLRAQPPDPPAPNLTVQALRMKGVPEADISAAMGNPGLMKQLVIQHYGPGSTGATTRYRADANNPDRLTEPSGFLAGRGWQFGTAPSQENPLAQTVGFECQGYPAGCQNGGSFGDNANYYAGGRDLCRNCAIRYLGIQDEPPIIQMQTLRGFEKK
jgi:hypothetical protein